MFAGLGPSSRWSAPSGRRGRPACETGLISNSWGLGIYDRAPIDLFDVAVISGEVGLHKPQPEIYVLACERLGVEPAAAVFVDDLRENCAGAEAVGMTAVLHRDAAETLARLGFGRAARAYELAARAKAETRRRPGSVPGVARLDHGRAVRGSRRQASPRRRSRSR